MPSLTLYLTCFLCACMLGTAFWAGAALLRGRARPAGVRVALRWAGGLCLVCAAGFLGAVAVLLVGLDGTLFNWYP